MFFTKNVTTYYLERNNAKKRKNTIIIIDLIFEIALFVMFNLDKCEQMSNTISVLLLNIHNTISMLLYTLGCFFRLLVDVFRQHINF